MAHILVIDDESVLLELISRTLRMDGHTVTAISDPIEAIDSRDEKQSIDLLLTDVDMRPISGFEVVKRLTDAGFNAPVLFMSGYPSLPIAKGGASEHAVIDKPFTTQQLRVTINRILAGRIH